MHKYKLQENIKKKYIYEKNKRNDQTTKRDDFANACTRAVTNVRRHNYANWSYVIILQKFKMEKMPRFLSKQNPIH